MRTLVIAQAWVLMALLQPLTTVSQTVAVTPTYVAPEFPAGDSRWECDDVQFWMDEYNAYSYEKVSDRSWEISSIFWNITNYPESALRELSYQEIQTTASEFTNWADGMQLILDTNDQTGVIPLALIEHHIAKITYARVVAYYSHLFSFSEGHNFIDAVIMKDDYGVQVQRSIALATERCGDSVRATLERGY